MCSNTSTYLLLLFYKVGLVCNIGTPGYTDWAGAAAISNGIRYLSRLSGYGTFNSHTSTRVSCSYGSGIFVVNNVRLLPLPLPLAI